ncbi:MAG: glycosyltransferase family 39 protein, partial [Bryobacteraceae bacterium]|nr:glycosyltransferase family 39 protein [Bryobacteraceae bacterium]
MTLSRLARLAYWVTPSLFCLVLYWYGFRSVYQMDDFAWLALPARVHDFQSFLAAMFQPLAQGTIRPWSERLFFFAGWHLFGLEATPLRVVVFVTQFANLVLLSAITRRLTGSSLAGLAAPILWLSNGTLYEPMAWTSTYNQVQCALFLLLALWFWILHIDTGAPKFLYWQWVVFVLGFGSLEINVVYPAIAALYALCFGRSYLPKTIPMFLVSAIYAAIHRFVAPPLA